MRRVWVILLLLVCAATAVSSARGLGRIVEVERGSGELLYLPNGRFLKVASLGPVHDGEREPREKRRSNVLEYRSAALGELDGTVQHGPKLSRESRPQPGRLLLIESCGSVEFLPSFRMEPVLHHSLRIASSSANT